MIFQEAKKRGWSIGNLARATGINRQYLCALMHYDEYSEQVKRVIESQDAPPIKVGRPMKEKKV